MRIRRLFLGLLVAGALTFVLGAATAGAARPLKTGVTTPDAGGTERLSYDRIKQAGADFTRITIYWSRVVGAVEPTAWDPTDPADPNYNWGPIDTHIQHAVAAGLSPLVQIYSAPQWAERCQTPGSPGICNPDPVDFQNFAAAAAKRYSGTFQGLPRVRY